MTSTHPLRDLVGDLRQIASVRRVALEDGPEAGVRALVFSTGGGLDFWAMSSRSLDIGPLWYCGIPVAWQAPSGFAHPGLAQSAGDGGRGVERMVSGLLQTCGLDHIRQAEGMHPLHGHLPMTPARITRCEEDWHAAQPVLVACGEVVQARLGGECLRLVRRIEAPVGGHELRVFDTVTNESDHPQPHDLLYHFNFGHPGIATGTTVALDGVLLEGPLQLPEATPPGPPGCVRAQGPAWSCCEVTTPLADGRTLKVALDFDRRTLPWLQWWRDLRVRTGILAIEPCTSAWQPGGRSGQGPLLAPGASVAYAWRLHCTLLPAGSSPSTFPSTPLETP